MMRRAFWKSCFLMNEILTGTVPRAFVYIEGGAEGQQLDPADGKAHLVLDQPLLELLSPRSVISLPSRLLPARWVTSPCSSSSLK